MSMDHEAMGGALVRGRMALRLETRGRRTGVGRPVVVGCLEESDGSLLVAATDPSAHWALNLLAEPLCHGTLGEERRAYRADVLEGSDRATAISGLILRYGTPSEGLGRGPAFRLVPLPPPTV